MLTVADRRERFFIQGSLIAAVAVLISAGLLLVWFFDHPYQNSSGSIKPYYCNGTWWAGSVGWDGRGGGGGSGGPGPGGAGASATSRWWEPVRGGVGG